MRKFTIGEQPWVRIAVALLRAKYGTKSRLASREQVAREIGISRVTLYDWLRKGTLKDSDAELVDKFSKASGVPTEWLLLPPPESPDGDESDDE